ncbi:MAG: putative metallo-hydrolase/oxidoreductase [Alphaproteobacteria bacterium]|nr:putative metallo-hydrolase/oxidoreductase [Alphaproteobacteria bacterium]
MRRDDGLGGASCRGMVSGLALPISAGRPAELDAQELRVAKTNPYYQGPPTDNFDGLRFFNPGEPDTDRSLGQMLRWKLAGGAAEWPKQVAVEPAVPEARAGGLRVTMVGHVTLLIQTAGLNILTDPVWSERASPFRFAGPRRVTAPGIAFDDLPAIDAVLLSHNHYDHLDIATLKRLHARDAPLIVTPLGNDAIVRRRIPKARIASGNWGARFDLGAGVEAHIVPANHWSSRRVSDRRMALWGGFMLRSPAGLVYFAGDTGYGEGRIFRAMREHHGPPDLALIPIGAYAPEWFMSAQHCDPDEAVRIMLDLEARSALGIHWGTFQLTDEGRDEPARRLDEALDERGVEAGRFVAAVPGMVWQG